MKKVNFVSAIALCATLALLSGCGEKKIDGSSEESFMKSAQAMSESLPDSKKVAFGMSIAQGQAIGIHAKGQTFAQALDGKTADEVIEFVRQGIKEKTTLRW